MYDPHLYYFYQNVSVVVLPGVNARIQFLRSDIGIIF